MLPGSEHNGAMAYGVTGDGRTIVGTSGATGEAVIWRDGVIASLGTLPNSNHARATSVCDDASVILGDLDVRGEMNRIGFIWTADHGMELLRDYFARAGITMPTGALNSQFWRVTADGRTLYGYDGYTSYIVSIPSPGVALAFLTGLAARSQRRR